VIAGVPAGAVGADELGALLITDEMITGLTHGAPLGPTTPASAPMWSPSARRSGAASRCRAC
jgi:hypothetical protein